MYADFIVLDTDLVSCTDMEILEAKVLRTLWAANAFTKDKERIWAK